jgi:hypothetical protein
MAGLNCGANSGARGRSFFRRTLNPELKREDEKKKSPMEITIISAEGTLEIKRLLISRVLGFALPTAEGFRPIVAIGNLSRIRSVTLADSSHPLGEA